MAKKKRRGSSMGKGTSNSRKNRKLGKKWLSIPKGFSVYKEEPETTIKIDILPYVVKDIKKHPESENMAEDVWYRYPYKIHRSVGPNREALLCPTTIGKPCPICEQMQEIYDDPDADNKAAGKFRPSKRSLFNIKMIGGDKKNKDKMLIWDMSDFCFFDQVDTELEHGEEEWNDFACLEGGYTLKVRLLEESYDKNVYAKADRIDFIERKDYDESILEETPCLDDVIIPNIQSYSEIEAILDGEESNNEEEEEEEEEEVKEKPKKKAPKKTKKKKEPIKLEWNDIAEATEEELIELAEERDFEVNEDDYDDEDELRDLLVDEFEIEKPKKKAKKETKKKAQAKVKKVTKKKKGELECPFAYKYGEEWGDHDECTEEDCEKHDDCFDVYDDMQDE